MLFRIKFFCVFSILSLLCGCSTRDALFEVNAQMDFRVDLGLSILETLNVVKGNVAIPLELTVQSTGISSSDITEVLPFEAFLKPRFEDNVNLDFINSVNVYIIDPVELRRKELFYLDFVKFGQKSEIELIPTLIDISNYVVNDKAIIEVSLEFRQFPPKSFDMRVQMRFAGFSSE